MKILETHIVPAITEKVRLQEYAPLVFKSITSRSGIKKAIKRQEILIDGKVAQTSHWIEENQTLTLLQPVDKSHKVFRKKMEVIFEDEFLAVVNKPAGIPTSGNYFKTVENALPYNLTASNEQDALPFPLPVHRLDNPTTGLLIAAKTRTALVKLNKAFENKEVHKIYLALVHGKIPGELIFKNPIDEKPAVTRINLIRHIQIENIFFSLVEAMPETGRTHQIRRHLAENDFPIAGDRLYGEKTPGILKGLYLTALGLKFIHPGNGTIINISLSYPKKFRLS